MAGQGGQPAAGQKSPEEQAAVAKAAAEKTTAEAKAKADAEAKAKADADAAAKPEPAKQEPKAGHVVIGAAVVLATEDGSERYLYRGAPVGAGFSKDSIKHAISVGLIEKVK